MANKRDPDDFPKVIEQLKGEGFKPAEIVRKIIKAGVECSPQQLQRIAEGQMPKWDVGQALMRMRDRYVGHKNP